MSKKSRERRDRVQKLNTYTNLRRKMTLFDRVLELQELADELESYYSEVLIEEPENEIANERRLQAVRFQSDSILKERTVIRTGDYENTHYECGQEDSFAKVSEWQKASIIPPYDNLFIDFGHVGLGDDSGVSEGFLYACVDAVLADEDEDWYDDLYICFTFLLDGNNCDLDDTSIYDSIYFGFQINLDRNGYSQDSFSDYNWLNTRKGETALNALYMAIHLLQLLNTRNIELVDHEPDLETSREYENHFRQPLTRYKTLVIKQIGKQHDSSDPKPYQDLAPLHLRRGNFATYTDDAPLFGKYTGTFWRPATVVGNEKNGVVIKDYKVKTAS